MKRFLVVLAVAAAIGTAGAGALVPARDPSRCGVGREEVMAYCTAADLREAYGEDRVAGWSRMNPETVEKAIANADAEIDGYLLSGGYSVPVAGPPGVLRKYSVDIACANLVVSAGVLEQDYGGNAVIEQAKIARRYLEKVAEGKFSIPGFAAEGEQTSPPSGGVKCLSMRRLDLRGY